MNAARMNDPARRDALIASSWNLHVGKRGDEPMTPRRAAELSQPERNGYFLLLAQYGGDDLYTIADAWQAYGMENPQ